MFVEKTSLTRIVRVANHAPIGPCMTIEADVTADDALRSAPGWFPELSVTSSRTEPRPTPG